MKSAMSNDQLIVIAFASVLICATFAPSIVLAPIKEGTSDQKILKWAGVSIGVLTATCAVLYLEILKIKGGS